MFDDWATSGDTSPALLRLLSRVKERNTSTLIRWNGDHTAGVRITQRELVLSGSEKIVTHVEAVLRTYDKEAGTRTPTTREPADEGGGDESVVEDDVHVILSIKHIHSASWIRELSVHRSVLFACAITNVDYPVEIPESSMRLFRDVAHSIAHTHIFIEKMLPYLKFPTLRNEVSIFWWRAVNDGCLVIQNWSTGRLLIFQSKGRSIKDASVTFADFYSILQEGLPYEFSVTNEDYESVSLAAHEEVDLDYCYGSEEDVAGVLNSWTLEDGVSPWLTKLVVKSTTKRNLVRQQRYSLGVEIQETPPMTPEDNDNNEPIFQDSNSRSLFLLIQVHMNEPLSRELRAYPVCMIPVAIQSYEHRDLILIYLRCLWFLRKLYEFHQSVNFAGNTIKIKNELRPYKRIDEKDLAQKFKLAGGAKLTTRKHFYFHEN
ncbi:hypothetical protein GNI_073980 [Gregarina niphandrodes]|uniref:Uncharacterized protein n=1 Tax=Gregarina niphandrodes TaxID=110365 RepID=A0A023B740_GRENI|nr:hypothetical protein GNI_073980 [Gregarina niphandrodes]EZG66917.1 hypothetical protein GNI_073980 [Gregarina niphandrodes]|eukprot:XP_011130423.1 hypothetical protein GNI_073980 [Gregarina niphandrodes]